MVFRIPRGLVYATLKFVYLFFIGQPKGLHERVFRGMGARFVVVGTGYSDEPMEKVY